MARLLQARAKLVTRAFVDATISSVVAREPSLGMDHLWRKSSKQRLE